MKKILYGILKLNSINLNDKVSFCFPIIENVDKILTNLNNLATNNPLKLYECIKNVNLELKRKKLSNNWKVF